ncbi:unnamed protein product [Rhizoctonia solani]|uniref:Transmembrane protein n=1 Tax=Rhizoctonia solani TaxID=456999 RepID=A0A8H2XXU5_9AGAM|nr:unnamed protein product [Rhizoctonia solani]
MPSFAQFAGLAAVVLSLGYVASALPLNVLMPVNLSCTGSDPVSLAMAKILVDLQAKISLIAGCNTVADLTIAVDALCAILKSCSDELLKIGAGAAITTDAQASIVACIAGIVTLVVRACISVTLKLGLSAVLVLIAKIDVALQLLLVNLNVCIDGIVVLIAKALASVTVGLLAQVQLKLCLGVLGLAGVSL